MLHPSRFITTLRSCSGWWTIDQYYMLTNGNMFIGAFQESPLTDLRRLGVRHAAAGLFQTIGSKLTLGGLPSKGCREGRGSHLMRDKFVAR